MKAKSWIARALVLVIAFASLIAAQSPANAVVHPNQSDLFNPGIVNVINLTVPTATHDALNNVATAKKYAAASFSFTTYGQTTGPISVGIRLKGSTSLELIDAHPSFKIAFNWKLLRGNRFLGLKNLTLNAMTQDGSKLHEFGAYKLFNMMGVPAPRTGWAELKINGVSRGLYVAIESVDDVFLGTKFNDVTQHLYEAIALNDLKPGHDDGTALTGHYLTKEGWLATPNKNDLTKLIAAANYSSGAKWWAKLGTVTDRNELVTMFATENFLGHWDSYSGPLQNNHFFRSNIKNRFSMIPWGTDQTFGENRATPTLLDDYFFPLDKPQAGFPWVQQAFHKDVMDRGLLFRKCLAYSVCKTAYLLKLNAVSAKITSSKFVNTMRNAATTIADYSGQNERAEQTRVQQWIVKQQARVSAVLKANRIN
jgi:spore coat protein CotH